MASVYALNPYLHPWPSVQYILCTVYTLMAELSILYRSNTWEPDTAPSHLARTTTKV